MSNIFKNINLNPAREEGETKEQYRARRRVNDALIKTYLKGTLIYNADTRIRVPKTIDGHVVRDESGEIVYTDKLAILGPYCTALMGSLRERHKL